MRVVVAGLALLALVACGDGDAEEPATPTVTATVVETPISASVLPVGDPGATVENVIQACREKDSALLRSFVAAPVREEEIRALFRRGTDVRLAGRTPANVEDGRATVSVRPALGRAFAADEDDGETEEVERTWELERGADGVWRFTALPDCY